ncbi:MAG TPA: hypothetical protein PKC18_16925 [Lacipirellulaceae bacterium]|nr:hypothetical protein [Lacipirellulaceae bacterium]
MKRLFAPLAAGLALLLTVNQTQAQNLLTGGDFEPSGGPVPGWNLQNFVTGSGNPINASTLSTNSPISGTRVLWLRAFAGGQAAGPNNLTNAVLSQTVAAMPGEQYQFSGWSRWEINYSGGVTTLSANGPLGEVPSPTLNTFQLEFLDASNNVLGAPVVRDLRDDGQGNFNFWVEHMLSGTAPAGTTQARVTAAARDMVWNAGPTQSAFLDNFSFVRPADPATQILVNPDLEDLPPNGLSSWTVVTDPVETTDVIRTESFANRPDSGGLTGVWLSPFLGSVDSPVDGILSQTVPGVAGGQYTFSGWSRWEGNYAGGVTTIDAGNTNGDGGKPSPTQTLMELAFLDVDENVIGAPVVLDLRTEQSNGAGWRQHTLNGTAPAGTEFVRVAAMMIDGVNNVNPQQSAFFDDFSLTLAGASIPGDLDGNGLVDGNDLLLIQRGLGSTTSETDVATWVANYGTGFPGAAAASGAVPEPAAAASALLAALGVAAMRRRRG